MRTFLPEILESTFVSMDCTDLWIHKQLHMVTLNMTSLFWIGASMNLSKAIYMCKIAFCCCFIEKKLQILSIISPQPMYSVYSEYLLFSQGKNHMLPKEGISRLYTGWAGAPTHSTLKLQSKH